MKNKIEKNDKRKTGWIEYSAFDLDPDADIMSILNESMEMHGTKPKSGSNEIKAIKYQTIEQTGLISISEFNGKECQPPIIAQFDENKKITIFKSDQQEQILKTLALSEKIDTDKTMSADEKSFLHNLCNSLVNEIKTPQYSEYSPTYKKEVLNDMFIEASEKAENLRYSQGFWGFVNKLRELFHLTPIKIKTADATLNIMEELTNRPKKDKPEVVKTQTEIKSEDVKLEKNEEVHKEIQNKKYANKTLNIEGLGTKMQSEIKSEDVKLVNETKNDKIEKNDVEEGYEEIQDKTYGYETLDLEEAELENDVTKEPEYEELKDKPLPKVKTESKKESNKYGYDSSEVKSNEKNVSNKYKGIDSKTSLENYKKTVEKIREKEEKDEKAHISPGTNKYGSGD